MSDLTEFTWIETDSVHLVGTSANAFPAPLLAKAAEALAEVTPSVSGDGMVKYVSADARRKYAHSGVAMSTGAFPIPDEGHLRSAIGRLAEYQGDKGKAKAHIIARAKALNLVHLLPKDWNVKKKTADTGPSEGQTDDNVEGDGREGNPDAEDRGAPPHMSDPHNDPSDGTGDTAPDKTVPTSEAEGQTRDNVEGIAKEGDSDGTGDRLEDKTVSPEAEESQTRALPAAEGPEASKRAIEIYKEMGMLTPEEADALLAAKDGALPAKGATTPGSPAWEHNDVALGEKAEQLVSQLAEVVRTFTEREKAEGGASKGARRVLAGVQYLTTNPTLLKECAEMPTDELVKALDELGAARLAAEKAEKKAKAKKAAKAERKAAKAAETAAKAAGDDADGKLAKAMERVEAAEKEAKEARELAEKIAAEDGNRIPLNGAGITAALRGPEASTVFKALEDRVADAEARLTKATNDMERMRSQEDVRQAHAQLTRAKLVAKANAEFGRFGASYSPERGPGSSRLVAPGDRFLEALPEDIAVKGI